MHLLTIIETNRLRQEGPILKELLKRLREDHDCHCTLVVPEALPDDLLDVIEDGYNCDDVLRTPIPCPLWHRQRAASALIEQISRTPLDLIWCTSVNLHGLVEAISKRLECPVAMSISSTQETRFASHRLQHIGAWIAPTPALAGMLTRRIGKELVQCIPPGIPHIDPPTTELGLAPTLALLSSEGDRDVVRAVLSGLQQVIAVTPELQICMELHDSSSHDAWREADAMGLLDHVSTIADAAQVRGLFTTCDLIVHPHRGNNVRTIALEAMAAARTIVSAPTPTIDWFIEGQTAEIVHDLESESWASSLLNLLNHPGQRLEYGQQARARVLEHHDCATQAAAWADLFEATCRGISYPFSTSQEAS